MRGLLALVLGAISLFALENAVLNLALRPLLNAHPDRLRIDYTSAWMLVPGHLHVLDLRIRNEGPADRWFVCADRAYGVVDLSELFDRSFHAVGVRGAGIRMGYERRDDVAPTEVAAARSRNPWFITLDDMQLDDVQEIQIGDYQLAGDATIAADVSLRGRYVDAEMAISIGAMRADLGDIPVAEAIQGDVNLVVEGMDREDLGPEELGAISGQAAVSADVQNLKFLDFYLAAVPWLALEGVGHVDADATVDHAQFQVGSELSADFPELFVRLVGDDVTGSGRLRCEVGTDADGEPESLIGIDFEKFSITQDGGTDALVEGEGFHVLAQSPDVALDKPFTSVSVIVELPESSVPDVARFNVFLPQDAGLSFREGAGTIHGRMVATSVGNHASGDLFLAADDVVVQFDALAITADLAVHARLADARLGVGWYDLSGTTAELLRVGIVDDANRAEHDRDRLWWASVAVQSGIVTVGDPIYLDTTMRLAAANSEPFVTVFAQRKALPGWVQDLLSVGDVSGVARVQLGAKTFAVSACQVHGGSYQVDLRLFRDGPANEGELLAQAGPLLVGIALRSGAPVLQVFGARRWFDRDAQISTHP